MHAGLIIDQHTIWNDEGTYTARQSIDPNDCQRQGRHRALRLQERHQQAHQQAQQLRPGHVQRRAGGVSPTRSSTTSASSSAAQRGPARPADPAEDQTSSSSGSAPTAASSCRSSGRAACPTTRSRRSSSTRACSAKGEVPRLVRRRQRAGGHRPGPDGGHAAATRQRLRDDRQRRLRDAAHASSRPSTRRSRPTPRPAVADLAAGTVRPVVRRPVRRATRWRCRPRCCGPIVEGLHRVIRRPRGTDPTASTTRPPARRCSSDYPSSIRRRQDRHGPGRRQATRGTTRRCSVRSASDDRRSPTRWSPTWRRAATARRPRRRWSSACSWRCPADVDHRSGVRRATRSTSTPRCPRRRKQLRRPDRACGGVGAACRELSSHGAELPAAQARLGSRQHPLQPRRPSRNIDWVLMLAQGALP